MPILHSCPFSKCLYMLRSGNLKELIVMDRYAGEVVDKIDQEEEFQSGNVIGYREDIVLFYAKSGDVGAIVFYCMKSKKVVRTMQVPFFSRNRARMMQMISGESGNEEIL